MKINQITEDLPISERKVARYVSENLNSCWKSKMKSA